MTDTTMQPEQPVSLDDTNGKVVILCEDGVNYRIFLPYQDTDYIQKKIANEKRPYELEMLVDIAARAERGDLILDIGANIGNHTLYLAATKGAKVVAFEPNPDLASGIRHSIALNGLDSLVSVRQVGIGKSFSRGTFKEAIVENLGGQSIQAGEGDIEIVPLDSIEFDQTVKIIKIDVEGMELPALQGAKRLIERDQPLLYIECMDESDYKRVSLWLDEYGYTYWDTFNATPTHLFIPSRLIDVEKRLARLQHKSVLETYRNTEALKKTRSNLDAANKKYREACIRIDQLKEKLSASEVERQKLIARLELMSSALSADEEEVSKKNQSDQVSAQNLPASEENNFPFIERRKSAQAEQGYRRMLEQAVEDKDAQLIIARQELEIQKGKSLQLKALYDALNVELEKVQAQYERELETRIKLESVLKVTREQADQARQQLDSTRAVLDKERDLLNDQIQQQTQKLKAKADLLQNRNDQISHLENQVAGLDEELSLLKQQHRTVIQHSNTLQEELHSEQQAKEALQSVLDATQAQVDLLQAQMNGADASFKDQNEKLLQQVEQLKKEKAVIEQEYSEQITAARNEVQQEMERALTICQGQYAQEREQMRAELQELQQQLHALQQERLHDQSLIKELQGELFIANEKRGLAEQRLIKTRASLTYQLGYQLKHSASSMGGMVKLPASLWRIYRQASKQRNIIQHHKQEGLATVDLPMPKHSFEAVQQVAEAADIRKTLLNPKASRLSGKPRIACIMDEFTYGSYQPECELQQLTPNGWYEELERFQPELLFIESAWRGKDELWASKVGHNSKELQQIIAWCKQCSIPTVFWNKEDPVHFETFLTTAKQFDFIFTTDIDCIHRYKAALGHERVYLLPFACQPAFHNPIELYERKDAFCFAGAYYVRYPERTQDLGNFVAKLSEFRPVEIYDRNYGKSDPNYQFPPEYQPFIVGTLPFEGIDRAYKGYRYAINLNSIKQSQTMFARRVYELLGSNTVTVSNYSRGVRLLFGDLVIATDNGEEMLRRLEMLAGDEEASNKLRLAALRKVMLEHTYEQRLHYVISKVTDKTVFNTLPQVAVLAYARSQEEMINLVDAFQRQTHAASSLYLLLDEGVERLDWDNSNIYFFRPEEIEGKTIREVTGETEWLAGMVPEDYYGPNYLLDMVVATRYSRADAVGKFAHYRFADNGIELLNKGLAYHKVSSLSLRSSMVQAHFFAKENYLNWVLTLPSSSYRKGSMLAIDPYNYCAEVNREILQEIEQKVNDLLLDTGLTISNLQARAENIAPAKEIRIAENSQVDLQRLQEIFGPCLSKSVSFQMEGQDWIVSSSLDDSKHEYIYSRTDLTLDDLGVKEQIKLFLELTPGLNLQLVILFLDAQKQRISHVMVPANRNHTFDVPPEAVWLRLGWRVYSSGVALIKNLSLDHKDIQLSEVLSANDCLVLTNNYPSYGELYRNGFVHSRVKSYREHGVNVDVFCFKEKESLLFREFEGQNVIIGGADVLDKVLFAGQYKKILVHFMTQSMWGVLQKYIDSLRVICWLHGAEIHPWYKRKFNYNNETQIEIAKLESEKRMSFWKQILCSMHPNLHLVIVSESFAKEIMDDVGFGFPADQHSIIHNPIDTQLFNYIEKPAEQRKKILLIRPFASRQYANDLAVKAILELSKKSFFKDLEFRIVGDGNYFEETIEPLRQFENIKIERRFLSHGQIAKLHKEYGIFLCPTRWDSHGVSRDEAMASGLVPVTNEVAAISEFVNKECGILAGSEDYLSLAKGIEDLFYDLTLFKNMSKLAAERVARQTSAEEIIPKELDLIRGIK